MTKSVKKTAKIEEVEVEVVKIVPVLHAHKLKLPNDPQGFSGNLRRELARAVGRIAGDEIRLASFVETLEVFADFARNKAEAQRNELKSKIADKAARLKTAQDQALREAEGVIASKRGALAKLQAEISAHDKRVEDNK